MTPGVRCVRLTTALLAVGCRPAANTASVEPVAPSPAEIAATEISVDRSWSRIEKWLGTHSPEALAALNPGAAAADVDALEAAVGSPLGPGLRASLRRHDGQKPGGPAVFPDGLIYLSVERIRADWEHRTRRLASMLGDRDDFAAWRRSVQKGVIFIGGPVRARLADPRWIPFADSNSDFFWFVDNDPAPGGRPGQIVHVDPEGTLWEVRADSFEEHLRNWADALERGDYAAPDRGDLRAKSPRRFPQGLPEYLR